MRACPVCGTENPEGARFCNHCGSRLAPDAPPPREERKLVTSHDTFGYFARRYGFEVVGAGLDSVFKVQWPIAW